MVRLARRVLRPHATSCACVATSAAPAPPIQAMPEVIEPSEASEPGQVQGFAVWGPGWGLDGFGGGYKPTEHEAARAAAACSMQQPTQGPRLPWSTSPMRPADPPQGPFGLKPNLIELRRACSPCQTLVVHCIFFGFIKSLSLSGFAPTDTPRVFINEGYGILRALSKLCAKHMHACITAPGIQHCS